MTFNEYQQKALSFRLASANDAYVLFNLVGEVGELTSLVAKAIRDGEPEGFFDLYKKELGDILWHVAVAASNAGISFDDVAQGNIDKLESRKNRGVIQGSGDNR